MAGVEVVVRVGDALGVGVPVLVADGTGVDVRVDVPDKFGFGRWFTACAAQ